jgi:hypothetical protein
LKEFEKALPGDCLENKDCQKQTKNFQSLFLQCSSTGVNTEAIAMLCKNRIEIRAFSKYFISS